MKTMDFLKTIAARGLKSGRCKQLMELMKDDFMLQDQASGERSQDQWSSGFHVTINRKK